MDASTGSAVRVSRNSNSSVANRNEQNVLTDEEFEAEKAKLLGG